MHYKHPHKVTGESHWIKKKIFTGTLSGTQHKNQLEAHKTVYMSVPRLQTETQGAICLLCALKTRTQSYRSIPWC